jgi:hypothetical protein
MDDQGESAMMIALRCNRGSEVIAALLGAGVDPGRGERSTEMTSVHYAAECGNYIGAQLCLDYGASPNILDGNGRTPLDYCSERFEVKAAESNSVESVLLRAGARCSLLDAIALGEFGEARRQLLLSNTEPVLPTEWRPRVVELLCGVLSRWASALLGAQYERADDAAQLCIVLQQLIDSYGDIFRLLIQRCGRQELSASGILALLYMAPPAGTVLVELCAELGVRWDGNTEDWSYHQLMHRTTDFPECRAALQSVGFSID